MPSEKELLALCLKWIQNPEGDAFDRAMLIEAIKAKLKPEREWVGLTEKEKAEIYDSQKFVLGFYTPANFADAIEAKLKEKNA